MGGSSKGGSTQTQTIPARTEVTPVQRNVSVVVGYKYYFGAHMALTHGPVDFVSRIKVGDKCAWSGISYGKPNDGLGTNVNSTGVRINISASNLFGGVDGEGGVSGPVDFLQGYDTQAVNDYLAARLGSADGTPAFRGVTSMVLRQVYVSANNPYLKPWQFTMSRTKVTSRGADVWYPNKSCIGAGCPKTYPYINEDGVEIYGPEVQPATVPIAGVGIYTVGDYSFIASAAGGFGTGNAGAIKTVTVFEDTEVDILLVGPGGDGSANFAQTTAYAGCGGGQVRIIKALLQPGEYTINGVGPGGVGAANIAKVGGGFSVSALPGATGVNNTAVNCVQGIGGDGVWSGSGGWAYTFLASQGACPGVPGGVGVGTSGGASGATGATCGSLRVGGGFGGGGGACTSGGSGSDATGESAGSGGAAGMGALISFDGTARWVGHGGYGRRGESACAGISHGSNGLDLIGKALSDGFPIPWGSGAQYLQRGIGGAVVIRWRT